ncbi:Uncharacterized protein ACO02O_06553 [Dirofilaria immitis]
MTLKWLFNLYEEFEKFDTNEEKRLKINPYKTARSLPWQKIPVFQLNKWEKADTPRSGYSCFLNNRILGQNNAKQKKIEY